MFDPKERIIQLDTDIDNWTRMLEENDQIVCLIQKEMVLTDIKYKEECVYSD